MASEQSNTTQQEFVVVDHASIAAAKTAEARVQAAYIMAIKRPRDEEKARNKIIAACKRAAFAEKVEYKKPVGKDEDGNPKYVTGPSIRFIETALREWGNIFVDTHVVYEDENIKRVKVICTDLETNAQFSRDISITKTVERHNSYGREVVGTRTNTQNKTVYIVKATEDEISNNEARVVSKAIRNEGGRLIPSEITDEAIETARATMAERDRQNKEESIKRIIAAFEEIKVPGSELKKYLGHELETITPEELADLRGIYREIKEGDASWKDYIVNDKPSNTPPSGSGAPALSIVQIDQVSAWMREMDLDLIKVASLTGLPAAPASIQELPAEAFEKLHVIYGEWQRSKKKK